MALTSVQINTFTQLAKKAGLNDSQIQQAIVDKERELQGGGTIDVTAQQASNAAKVANTNVANAGTQPASNNPLVNIGKAIVDPALKFGSFVSEAAAQGVRAVVDPIKDSEGLNNELSELISQNKYIITQAKAERDPAKKQELLQQSREIDQKIAGLGTKAGEIANTKSTFVMKEEELGDTVGEIALEGTKRTAGAMSYAVPGSLGTGATVAGTIARTAGAGAIAGGMQGFGASEDGKELESTITGATVGGAVGGAFAGAGQALRAVRESRIQSDLGKRIAQTGTEFKKSGYVKAIGRKPIMREGGDALLDKMMKAGIKPGTPDEVIFQADDILMENAGVIFDKADEFKQNGITIDKAKILDPLQQKLDSAPAKSKPIIQKVIDFVKADLDKFEELTPAEAYAMKGDYGPFGNWNSTMDADAITEAGLWEDIYKNLNGLMDESFKKGGYDDFRAINEVVSTAISAKKYASRAGNVAPNLNTLGLMDVLYGGAGFAASGLPGMAAGYLGKKIINAPITSTVIGDTLERVGKQATQVGSGAAREAGSELPAQVTNRITQRAMVGLTGSGDFIANPNEDGQSNSNQDSLENSFNQNNAPTTNNADIVPPQVTFVHPDPKFRMFKTKQEMVAQAFKQGADAEVVEELKKMWDANAPDETDLAELLTKRKALAENGFSTEIVDLKLAQMGYSQVGGASKSEAQKKFGPAVTRALDQLETISGIGTKDTIFQGGSTTLGKSLKSSGISARKATDEKFAQKTNQYKSSLQLVVGAINQMLGAGTLNEGEATRLLDTMPDEFTSDADAKAWFANARMILGVE